jgi:hypothetical protein
MTPQSRKEQLLTQRVGDELVVYDERTHEAHRLNRTAAEVWEQADGARTVPELASSLRQSLAAEGGAAVGDQESEELVRLALDNLDRAGLLVRGLPAINEPMSRRQMLVVAAALLPVVASIVAPTPAMAQSFFPSSSSSSSSSSTTPGNTGT